MQVLKISLKLILFTFFNLLGKFLHALFENKISTSTLVDYALPSHHHASSAQCMYAKCTQHSTACGVATHRIETRERKNKPEPKQHPVERRTSGRDRFRRNGYRDTRWLVAVAARWPALSNISSGISRKVRKMAPRGKRPARRSADGNMFCMQKNTR